MAAPFVSGVAALLAGKGLSNRQILECIRTTSSGGGNYNPVMGYGIVDADTATRNCSAARTPGFAGTSGRAVVKVTARRTKRPRRVRVTVKSSRAVVVKLRAVVRKRTVGRRTVRLRRAGTKRLVMKLHRHHRGKVRLRWSAPGRRGVAKVR